MKKALILLFLPLLLLSGAKQLSPLPLPQIYFLDLDTYHCDRYCLQNHLARGEIFSFLAKLRPEFTPYFKNEITQIPFMQPIVSKKKIRLTLIAPSQKLSSLLSKSAKIVGLYLLQNYQPFELTTKINPHIQSAIDQSSNSDLIILFLPFSQKELLSTLHCNTKLFIPTINKRFIQNPQNFYYGGIDYIAQIDKLLDQKNGNRLTIFSSPKIELLDILTHYTTTKLQQTSVIEVKNKGNNLKWEIKERKSLQDTDILLNTPLITTSLVLSQLTLYDYNPPHKFSTQINLSAKLFEFTQERDRDNLLVADSILSPSPQAEATASLAKSNLFYDWISYACIVAINNLFLDRTAHETFNDRQIEYKTELWRYKAMGFEQIPQENNLESLPDDSL